MDTADLVVSAPDVEGGEANGVHMDEPYEGTGDENIAVETVNGKLDLLEISDVSAFSEVPSVTKDGGMTEPSLGEVDSEECYGSPAPREVGLQEAHHEKTSKEQMSQGKSKTANPLSSKIAGPNGRKKTSRKEEKVTSSGISSASSHPKKPILTSTKPSNDGKVATGNANKMKPVLASNNAKNTKQVPSINVEQSNEPMEKTKLKPLKKEAQHKMEGDQDIARSPTAEDAQSQRVGKLPTYGFSFKCYERAEKRKEFYSKLEEKIQAKEVEIINREAQSKESQEAEIKMLRKSLNFKATPMPNFYQEPIPPKVELKKIPITRPKSPKLGRRKSSSAADVDVDDSHNHPKGKLELGEKISQNKPAKISSLTHPEKPQRKSLPRLPSQKTPLSKSTEKALPSTKNMINSAAPPTQIEPQPGTTELGQSESIAEIEQVIHLEESHTMPAKEHEPVTLEL